VLVSTGPGLQACSKASYLPTENSAEVAGQPTLAYRICQRCAALL